MGVAAAIAGAAVVGAGASVYAGSKAAKAQKQGAQTAADTERYMYDTTRADYAPYREVGQGALYKLAGMYGVDVDDTSNVNWDAYVQGNPDAMANWQSLTNKQRQEFGSLQQFGKYHYEADGSRRDLSPYGATSSSATGGAYGGFQESPGYAFRRDEAMKAIERSAASRGLLGSGGTVKAIGRYADNLASSEYENYANRLAALAGVGQTATSGTAAAGAQAASGIASAAMQSGNAQASGYINTGNAINQGVQNIASAYLYNKGGGFGG